MGNSNSKSKYPLDQDASVADITDVINKWSKETGRDVRVLEDNKVNRELALEVVMDAFSEDPMFRSIVKDDDVDEEEIDRRFQIMLKFFMNWSIVQGFELGVVLGAFDGDDLVGAAACIRPGVDSEGIWNMVKTAATTGAPPIEKDWKFVEDRMNAMQFVAKTKKALMRGTDFWYLYTLGVKHEAHGKGVGGSLLRALHHLSDLTGCPCYLETELLVNQQIYEHMGWITLSQGKMIFSMERKDWYEPFILMTRLVEEKVEEEVTVETEEEVKEEEKEDEETEEVSVEAE